MQYKNNTILIVFVGLLGIAVGWLVWGRAPGQMGERAGHRMSEGTMMRNDGMDMSSMMADMNANLAGKTGDDFDRAFLAEMIVHHEGAVEMAKLADVHAKHKEIKDLSAMIISAQNKEIAEMKAWQEKWYGALATGETFTGKITAVSTACFTDGICSVSVDGKVVVTTIGWSRDTVGSIKGKVSDIGSLESMIGAPVKVYAKKTTDGYTLYGSSAYYIEVL